MTGQPAPDRRLRAELWTGAALVLGFVALAAAIAYRPDLLLTIDTPVRHVVTSTHAPSVRAAARVLAAAASLTSVAVVAVVVAVVLRAITRRWVAGGVLLGAFAVSVLTVNLVKAVVARARPGLEPGAALSQADLSFPSGHVTNSSVVLVLSVLLLGGVRGRPRRWGWRTWLLLLALLIVIGGVGWTRLALDEHWLSDVLGGWLLAAAVVCFADVVRRRVVRPEREPVVRPACAPAPPGTSRPRT